MTGRLATKLDVQQRLAERNAVVVEKHVLRREVKDSGDSPIAEVYVVSGLNRSSRLRPQSHFGRPREDNSSG